MKGVEVVNEEPAVKTIAEVEVETGIVDGEEVAVVAMTDPEKPTGIVDVTEGSEEEEIENHGVGKLMSKKIRKWI